MKRLLLTLAIALPILAYVGEWMGAFAWSDSSIFRYIGKCVAEGGVMYQCAWDNKGPMLLLPNALGWRLMGVHGPGLVMMLMGLASVVLLHHIATLLAQEVVRRVGGRLLHSHRRLLAVEGRADRRTARHRVVRRLRASHQGERPVR